MQVEGSDNTKSEYTFDFAGSLTEISPADAQLSRGFLRCRPEKWFPGFAAHWLPLWHSLGIDARVVEIKPQLRAARNIEKGFYGVVDNERVAICMDGETEQLLLSAIAPGAGQHGSNVILEYLARRFFSSAGLSWSAAENAKVQFLREIQTHDFSEAGAVKVTFSLNNNICTAWLLLGETLIQRLDGLWRRQLKSSQKAEVVTTHSGMIELMSIAVPQAGVADIVKSGSFIPCSENKIDMVQLYIDQKPYLPARLCSVDDSLALQTIASTVKTPGEQDGHVQLRVVYKPFPVDSSLLAEIAQISAVFITPIDRNNPVELYIQERKVAEGRIATSYGNVGVLVS